MKFHILTLFPDLFASFFQESIIARAKEKNLFDVRIWNIRDFSMNKHHRVDDTPYGGGAGMLLTCQPLFDCIEAVKKEVPEAPVCFLTPHGKIFEQSDAEDLSKQCSEIILLCGRYEGIDQRVRDALVDKEFSIGKYVLTGGEIPAQVLMDAVIRLIPGVLGNETSHEEESFSKSFEGKCEYPQYTKPEMFRGMSVPKVLLSGDHAKIEQWKQNNLT